MSDRTFGYLSNERAEELCRLLSMQCEVFEGMDGAHQSDALTAAALLIPEQVRALVAALLVVIDRMELLDDQKREVVEAALARAGSATPTMDRKVLTKLRDCVKSGDPQWIKGWKAACQAMLDHPLASGEALERICGDAEPPSETRRYRRG